MGTSQAALTDCMTANPAARTSGTSAPAPAPVAGLALCRVLRFADAALQSWRNGSGITRQLAVWPPMAPSSDFTWRVSAADVTEAGRFSDWSGFDRQLWITQGPGIRLTDPAGGATATLRRGERLDFPGERRYACALLGGPVRDLNVMLKRGRGTLQSTLVRGDAAWALVPGHHILYCAAGSARVLAAGQFIATLGPGDALHLVPDTGGTQPRVSIVAGHAATECIAIHLQTQRPPASVDNRGRIPVS